jgi:hypothetical protein
MSPAGRWFRELIRRVPRVTEGERELAMIEHVLAHTDGLREHGPGLFPPFPGDLACGPLVRMQAVLRAMTREERACPWLFVFEPARAARVARGAGVRERDVADVVRRVVRMRELAADARRPRRG